MHIRRPEERGSVFEIFKNVQEILDSGDSQSLCDLLLSPFFKFFLLFSFGVHHPYTLLFFFIFIGV